jgi:DNA-binding response OmpR family regulator
MQPKILMIEDDEQIRRMYAEAFGAQGFNCDMAEDGMEGIKKAQQNKPDLILLDIMMPNVDGLSVLAQMKKDPNLSSIPVVILSNLSTQEGINKAMELGAKEYVNKSSVKPRDVIEKVRVWLANPQPV